MNSSIFKQGVKIQKIYIQGFEDSDNDESVTYNTDAGTKPYNCKSITVNMECGEMAMVPWAKIVLLDGTQLMVKMTGEMTVTLSERV